MAVLSWYVCPLMQMLSEGGLLCARCGRLVILENSILMVNFVDYITRIKTVRLDCIRKVAPHT